MSGGATDRGRSREDDFNRGLAAAMESVCDFPDVEFLGEQLGHLEAAGKHVDVLVYGNRRKSAVAVECEYGTDPMGDADARLGEPTTSGANIRAAIGVRVPERARRLERGDQHAKFLIDGKLPLEYAAIELDEQGNKVRWPKGGFIKGSVGSLTEFACGYLTSRQELQTQAETTAAAVEQIADDLAAAINDNTKCYAEIKTITGREGREESLRATGLVWLDAFLFQDRVAAHPHSLPDKDNDEKPPRQIDVPSRSVAYNGSEQPIPSRVLSAWQTILEINYGSIYSPASELLSAIRNYVGDGEISAVLHIASSRAETVASSSLGVFDLSGELFQRLLLDRVAAAAYYTRPEVAEFLARMTATDEWLAASVGLPPEPSDPQQRTEWAEQHRSAVRKKLQSVKFGDFACGTGSLLRATYRRLRALAHDWRLNDDWNPNNRKHDDEWFDIFHRWTMETAAAGFDISPIATHLTSSSLANLSPQVPYTKTNIGLLSVCEPTTDPVKPGGKRRNIGDATTGGLELLATDQLGNLFSSGNKTATGENEIETLVAADGSFDLVLMNPPYARAVHTQKGDEETKRSPFFGFAGTPMKLQDAARKRAAALTKDHPCSVVPGLATVFSVIAKQKVRAGGRIGLILPLTAATASGWAETREMFATEFDDLTIATFSASSIGKGHSASAATTMGEMMLTATKREKSGGCSKSTLTTINLFAPFTSTEAAKQIAAALTYQLANNQQMSGVAYVGETAVAEWVITDINEPKDVWPFAAVSSLRLAGTAERFASDGELTSLTDDEVLGAAVPMKPIGEIFELGQTHNQIGAHHWSKTKLGAFALHPVSSKKDLRRTDLLLWGNNSKTQRTIAMSPTHYGMPYGTKTQCEVARSFTSQLFHNNEICWTSQRCLAATTDKPYLSGSAWMSLSNDDPVVRFGFAVYANSILGFLVGWSRGGKQQDTRTRHTKTTLAKLPCPDFTDPTIHAHAKRLMEERPELETLELLPAVQAHVDPNRRLINEAAAEMLGLPAGVLEELAAAWVEEPSVRGKSGDDDG